VDTAKGSAPLLRKAEGYLLQCCQNVVKEENFCLRVDSPGEGNSSLLSTTESKAFFTDFSLVTGLEQCEITFKTALVYNFIIPLFVERCSKENIILSLTSTNSSKSIHVTYFDSFVLYP
jgi:hypothetical protein